ncbi:MAG: uridine kinase [Defluviitaleaceae bacterium]|nr:uridine kinase [Defluviitaleaceae bacterium]
MPDNIISAINAVIAKKGLAIVAIDGDAAAGKTTLADSLSKHFGVASIVRMDHFFLPKELRSPSRLEEIGGNIHYERFEEEILQPMAKEEDFCYRNYSCAVWDYIEKICIIPKNVVIIEGSYSMHPKFVNSYDIKIFMKIDKNAQLERILARNGSDMAQKFKNIWIPMEKRYHTHFGIEKLADFIVTT